VTLTVRLLDGGPQPKKRLRLREGEADEIETLPAEWRDLIAIWLRRAEKSKSSCRWETLANSAGAERYPLAQRVLEWLLNAGWVGVTEERRHGAWWPVRVEFLHSARLRDALGMPDPRAAAQRWEAIREQCAALEDGALLTALASLEAVPAARAADRGELLLALSRWRNKQRSGTRRDFALFARGTTKAVTDAEWRWLEEALDLADFGIERHTPLLLIAAPLILELPDAELPLGAFPDFAALTPASLDRATAARGKLTRWRLIENRTSFERMARRREPDIGVVWLPGYPPSWWRGAMAKLLALSPASAEIACDPDPAGIAIALEACRPWAEAGIAWEPWRMAADELAGLRSRQPLTAIDRRLLECLKQRALPGSLAGLARWMFEHGEKGEQEGYL
jgi:hypothetical protein